jgi:hypothetical protein
MDTLLQESIKSGEALLAKAKKATTVEEGDRISVDFRKILKDLSQVQRDIGSLRNESNKIIGLLRQASPKGAPVEGSTREINDKKYIFTSGKYYLIADTDTSGK